MNKWIVSILLCLPITGFSLLPPVWQGVAEIKAIVEDPRLNDFLQSGDILEGIIKSKEGWLIKTSHQSVFVQVVPLPQSMPGPMKFELRYSIVSNTK